MPSALAHWAEASPRARVNLLFDPDCVMGSRVTGALGDLSRASMPTQCTPDALTLLQSLSRCLGGAFARRLRGVFSGGIAALGLFRRSSVVASSQFMLYADPVETGTILRTGEVCRPQVGLR